MDFSKSCPFSEVECFEAEKLGGLWAIGRQSWLLASLRGAAKKDIPFDFRPLEFFGV